MKRIALVSGTYHKEILDQMIESASAALAADGAEIVEDIRVPGAYEIPLATERVFERGVADGIVVLGAIEKGETLDGEVMGHVVNHFLIKLQLKYGKPIGVGIIGPGATREQMNVRAASKAQAAVNAVLTMLNQPH